MQELEKILEEIEKLRGQVGSECTSEDHYIKKAWEHCLDRVVGIIRKRMNDGWIPVEERLPEEWEKVIVWYEYFRYGEYNRMYETYGIGWQYDGHWAGDVSGTKARCIAWQPLPEPYRLKQPETCKYTGGSCCWPVDLCRECPNHPERSDNHDK